MNDSGPPIEVWAVAIAVLVVIAVMIVAFRVVSITIVPLRMPGHRPGMS